MSALTEDAGPLPVWAWIAIIGAVIVGAMHVRGKASASASAQQNSQSNAQTLGVEEAELANAATQQSAQQAQVIGAYYSNGGGTYGSGYFPNGQFNGYQGGRSYQT